MTKTISAVLLAAALLSAPAAAAREGFGFKKKAVTLHRKVPPRVVLTANRFDVRVTEDAGEPSAASDLAREVVSRIPQGDSRFRHDTDRPEMIVEVELRQADVDENWIQKTEYERRRVGSKTTTDKNGNTKTEPVYDSVPVQVSYEEIEGRVSARYRVVNASTKKELYRSDESSQYRESFKQGGGSPSERSVIDDLVDEVGAKIAASLAGTTEPVSALVPRASFEKLLPLAEQGQWAQYLSAVETMPAKKSPQDEAYRQYALGVAREALAYGASTEKETLDLLRQAATHYRQAVAMNPKEELFAQEYENFWTGGEASSPLERVEEGAENYAKLAEQRVQLASASKPPVTTTAKTSSSTSSKSTSTSSKTSSSKSTPSKSASKPLTNASIVEMAKAGLSDENIILAIDSSSSRNFDLTPDGLIALAKAGVSREVIAHMQRKK